MLPCVHSDHNNLGKCRARDCPLSTPAYGEPGRLKLTSAFQLMLKHAKYWPLKACQNHSLTVVRVFCAVFEIWWCGSALEQHSEFFLRAQNCGGFLQNSCQLTQSCILQYFRVFLTLQCQVWGRLWMRNSELHPQ